MNPSPRNRLQRGRSIFADVEMLESRIAPAAIVVNTLKDTTGVAGQISLRDAILAVNASGDATNDITFSVHGTIKLTADLPIINVGAGNTLNITGPLATKPTGVIVDGAKTHLPFNVHGGVVTFTDITVTHGFNNAGTYNGGGGFYIDDSDKVQLNDVTVSANKVVSATGDSEGGGIYITSVSDVTIQGHSKIAGNIAFGQAGWGGGAGIYSAGTVEIKDSLVTGNTAQGASGKAGTGDNGYGAYGGGIYLSSGTGTIEDSTFSKNKSLGGNGASNKTKGGTGGHGEDGSGGGLYNWQGTMIVKNSVVTGNTAKGGSGGKGGAGASGGAGYGGFGGGVYSDGSGASLTLQDGTIVTGNKVSGGKAGAKGAGFKTAANASLGYGGGVYCKYTTNITNVTITKNSAGTGGGVYMFGGTATISGTTISQNKSTDDGGGVKIGGGTLTFDNCTIAKNSTSRDGGAFSIGSQTATIDVKLHNSTIAQNSAKDTGGGLDVFGAKTSVDIISTIIAKNKAKHDGDMDSQVGDVTMNFSLVQAVTDDTAFDDGGNANNITGKDPLLGTLKNNGGLTMTMMPAANSPVIDQGKNVDSITTDQIGNTRTVDNASVTDVTGGDATDIGAVELQT